MDAMATAVQSPGKLRLHKRHYLNEVVRERVDYHRRESKPVDPTSISKISQYITPSGEKGSIIYTEPESHPFKAAPSPRESGLLLDSLSSFFSDSKVENVYSIALTTVDSFRETEGSISKHELLQFVKESFELSDEKRKLLQDKATTLETQAMNLTCHVLGAKELVTKDTAGTNDLYCQLGVLCEDSLEKDVTKQKKNIRDWQKEKLVESVGRTSVWSESLEPEWDEVIQLSATKPRKEKLVLEIWNGDEMNGGATKSKSFVGRFFYPLQYIPTSGVKKTLPLRSHSGKSERGFITVKLTIDQESCLLDFAELACAMVNVSAKESGSYVRRWNGQLTLMAEKLLDEYAALNDIDDLYRACIHLSVLVKYHKLYAVNMAAICDLIRKIKHHVALADTNPPIAHDHWEKLLADLKEVNEEMEGIMKNHIHMFNLESEDDVEKIQECVQTLCELYSFQPFTQRLPPGSGSLKEMLRKCIAVAVPKWFHVQEAQMQPQVQTENGRLIAFRDLSKYCLQQCGISLETLKPIFTEANVDYFTVFYIALDSQLGGEAKSRMKEHSESSDATTYEIYLIFREMAELAQHIDNSGFNPLYDTRENLLLPQYYKWFQDMVKNWFSLAIEKCKNLTVQAISADSAIAVTDLVNFSTSAVDVTGFLLQIGHFWKNLNWPEAIAAYGFASLMMEEINKCVQFYVEEVAKRLTSEDVFDENGRFRATEKLCIVLNNMQHVREELCHFEERLEFESFYKWLDSEDESTLGTQCRAMVKKQLGSADDDIYNRMSKIMSEITDKLSPDIETFVHGVVSESKTDAAKDEFEIIAPLMDYLTNNLQVFADNLFPAVFEIILCNLWQLSLDCLLKCLKEVQLKKGSNSAQLHQRSFTMLKALKDFYHSEEGGIREEDLKTDTYNRLYSQLDVLRLTTDELILRFLSEFVEIQHREWEGDKEFGSLHVSVCYLKEESMVEVSAIKGERLPSSSKNGWYVQLCLMPQTMFPNSNKIAKTGFQKRTTDPVFDDTIKIPATNEAMKIEGTVLLLSLFDHTVIGSDDFIGTCVVACKDIPISSSDGVEQKNLTLPIFRFIDLTYAMAELEFRADCGDAKASGFLRSNIKKALSYLPRPRSGSRSRRRSKNSVSYLEDSNAVQL